MDDEFGVSNVVDKAFANVAKTKIKKEPVSIHILTYFYVMSLSVRAVWNKLPIFLRKSSVECTK